jgi:hypothetical protein
MVTISELLMRHHPVCKSLCGKDLGDCDDICCIPSNNENINIEEYRKNRHFVTNVTLIFSALSGCAQKISIINVTSKPEAAIINRTTFKRRQND